MRWRERDCSMQKESHVYLSNFSYKGSILKFTTFLYGLFAYITIDFLDPYMSIYQECTISYCLWKSVGEYSALLVKDFFIGQRSSVKKWTYINQCKNLLTFKMNDIFFPFILVEVPKLIIFSLQTLYLRF